MHHPLLLLFLLAATSFISTSPLELDSPVPFLSPPPPPPPPHISYDKNTDSAAFSFSKPDISPTINICGLDDPLFQFDVIRLDPEPPVKGAQLNVHVEGTLHQTITGGDIHIVVKLGYVKLITLKLDLCENSAKIDFPCPISAGKKVFDGTYDIPKEIVRGKYVIDALVIANTNEQIACVTATVHFP